MQAPQTMEIAKIILLKKPDQLSYIILGTYRPILLLFNLSKAMESAIATRIGYLTEKYSLLPSKHFNGLKGKSTIHVLLTLQEKVYQDWQDKKVLLLVTFNIKSAFNGVAPNVLIY